jgi:hypothetical protein
LFFKAKEITKTVPTFFVVSSSVNLSNGLTLKSHSNRYNLRFGLVLKIAEKDKTLFVNNQPVKLLELANFSS